MKILTHNELLSFEAVKLCPSNINLADFLARYFYGAKLENFPKQNEPFKIVGENFTLSVSQNNSILTANKPEYKAIAALYCKTIDYKRKLRKTFSGLKQSDLKKIIQNSLKDGLKGLKTVDDNEYKLRVAICQNCQYSNCKTIARLTLASSKCPHFKW